MQKKITNSQMEKYIKGNLINIFSLNNKDKSVSLFNDNLKEFIQK